MTTSRTASLSVLSNRQAWRWKLHRFATDTTSSEDNLFRLLAVEFKIVRSCQILNVAKFITAITGIHCGTIRYVSSANLMMSLSAWSGRKSAALIICWPQTWASYYASRHSCDRRVHVGVTSRVRAIAEKIYDPVVDLIGLSCEAQQLSPLQSCVAPCQINAFEMSRAKTRTYGLAENIWCTQCVEGQLLLLLWSLLV